MRRSPILSSVLVCLSLNFTSAQQFILTSELGGGRLYSLETTGANPAIFKDFSHGSRPLDILTLADNKYWGLTPEGGRHGYGLIFSINLDGSNYTEHHYFDHTEGTEPSGELTLIDGKLWGVTLGGGNIDRGVVFTIDFSGNFTKVVDMQDVGASMPQGKLVDYNGKIWGVTTNGAANNDGCIFYFNYDGTGIAKLHEFAENDGANPEGGLTLANNELWGITRLGGVNNAGTIFTIDQTESVTTNRHEFNTTDGYLPFNYLVESGGEMWGMTKHGGTNDDGVIFSIATSDYNFTKHHDFSGSQSTGPLLNVGNDLWGLANEGGTLGFGSLFKIVNDGSGFEELVEFDFNNGAHPKGGLTKDGDRLIGMTEYGGHSLGTIFTFDVTTEAFETIHNFGNPDGNSPIARPIESCGILMGGAGGGPDDHGVIYQVNLDGTNYTILYEMNDDIGSNPSGFVTHEGKTWGFASGGGLNDAGTIFNMNLDGSSLTKVHDFETNNGNTTVGPPMVVNDLIYGTTKVGGTTNKGVIFSIDPGTNDFTKRYEFSDGQSPSGNLYFSSGRLWGTTISGGTNFLGILFSILPDGSDFMKHHDFENGVSGLRPEGSLIESDGRIWGISTSNVYSIATDGTDFKVEHTLTNDQGTATVSGIIAYDNKLWIGGGLNQDLMSVSLLSMNPDGTSLTKLNEYTRDYGVPTSITIVEDKMAQTITGDPVAKTFGDAAFTLDVLSNTSNTFNYTGYDESLISITGSEVSILGAGETSIFVYQDADASYYSGCHSIAVTIGKASQLITFEPISDKLTTDIPFDVTASSDSGLDVVLESSDEGVATVSGKTVTIQGIGEVSITATQVGDNNYLAAAEVIQTFNVNEPPTPPLSIVDEDQLIIYPNPTNGAFNIEIEGLDEVSIFDISGRLVETRKVDGVMIAFSGYPSGVYVVKGEGNGGVFTRRLIIK